jgi:hypothetical protein
MLVKTSSDKRRFVMAGRAAAAVVSFVVVALVGLSANAQAATTAEPCTGLIADWFPVH